MARRVEHTVALTAVPRPWLVGFIAALYEQRKPPPGVTITRWDRRRIEGMFEDEAGRADFVLESVDDPRTVTAAGEQVGDLAWNGAADLVRGTAAVDLRFTRVRAHADIRILDMAADPWLVHVKAKVRARGWVRPVMLLAWGWFSRQIVKGIEETACEYNAAVGPAVTGPPDQAIRW